MDKLKKILQEKDLTQAALCRAAGLQENILSMALSGRLSLRDDECLRIALALKMKVEEIFGND